MQTKNTQRDNYLKTSIYKFIGKRIFDLLLAIPVVIVLSPIGVILSVLIKLDSQGPVIYKQKRVGLKGNDFYVYKFRTMVSDADKIGPTSTKVGDSRVTKIGKVLRKLSLDELPQLFNVILGQMSLVGYRPGVRENYTESDLESEIFNVKPGITGYAQVMGRSDLTKEKKREWELKYVDDVSFKTDVKIIWLTIKKVVTGESAY